MTYLYADTFCFVYDFFFVHLDFFLLFPAFCFLYSVGVIMRALIACIKGGAICVKKNPAHSSLVFVRDPHFLSPSPIMPYQVPLFKAREKYLSKEVFTFRSDRKP